MEKSDIKSVSIIVGRCLACDGVVRIPANANIHSTVRCPHCSESFPLQAILEQSVPELEVIGSTEQRPEEIIPHFDRVTVKKADEELPREKFVVPRQLTMGAKRKRRHRRRDKSSNEDSSRGGASQGLSREQRLPSSRHTTESNATESNGTDGVSGSDIDGIQSNTIDRNGSSSVAMGSNRNEGRPSIKSTAHSSQTRGRSKHRSRQESAPLKEILKVVVGGAMAFPIAYLMLFWFFKQDPLNLGPSVSRVVPFVVPAELRDRIEEVESDSEKAKSEKTIKSKKTELRETDESSRTKALPIPDVDPDKIMGNQDDLLID